MDNYFVHSSSFIDDGAEIGAGTKIWHFCHIMPNAKIGSDCNIGQNVFVASGVIVGNGVKIQNNISIYAGVVIEDDVFLGPSMVFTNVVNPRSHVNRRDEYQTTLIKRGSTIGANATIVCGITLEEYSFVGAGAVVTQDIPAYSLVYGTPAKIRGWMCKCGNQLNFHEQGQAVCQSCGDVYRRHDQLVSPLSS